MTFRCGSLVIAALIGIALTAPRAEVVTVVFTRGDSRITADFVEDVMIRFTVVSR